MAASRSRPAKSIWHSAHRLSEPRRGRWRRTTRSILELLEERNPQPAFASRPIPSAVDAATPFDLDADPSAPTPFSPDGARAVEGDLDLGNDSPLAVKTYVFQGLDVTFVPETDLESLFPNVPDLPDWLFDEDEQALLQPTTVDAPASRGVSAAFSFSCSDDGEGDTRPGEDWVRTTGVLALPTVFTRRNAAAWTGHDSEGGCRGSPGGRRAA
jgi:hypothetical protein